jgi:hypothetical protein
MQDEDISDEDLDEMQDEDISAEEVISAIGEQHLPALEARRRELEHELASIEEDIDELRQMRDELIER